MAKNIIFEPTGTLSVPVPDGTESGEAFILWGILPAVALTDKNEGDNITGNATVAVAPSWVADLPVKGEDGAGNAAVSIGELLFIDTDGELNVDLTNGTPFGIAMEAVSSGATDTIRVYLLPATYVPA